MAHFLPQTFCLLLGEHWQIQQGESVVYRLQAPMEERIWKGECGPSQPMSLRITSRMTKQHRNVQDHFLCLCTGIIRSNHKRRLIRRRGGGGGQITQVNICRSHSILLPTRQTHRCMVFKGAIKSCSLFPLYCWLVHTRACLPSIFCGMPFMLSPRPSLTFF